MAVRSEARISTQLLLAAPSKQGSHVKQNFDLQYQKSPSPSSFKVLGLASKLRTSDKPPGSPLWGASPKQHLNGKQLLKIATGQKQSWAHPTQFQSLDAMSSDKLRRNVEQWCHLKLIVDPLLQMFCSAIQAVTSKDGNILSHMIPVLSAHLALLSSSCTGTAEACRSVEQEGTFFKKCHVSSFSGQHPFLLADHTADGHPQSSLGRTAGKSCSPRRPCTALSWDRCTLTGRTRTQSDNLKPQAWIKNAPHSPSITKK